MTRWPDDTMIQSHSLAHQAIRSRGSHLHLPVTSYIGGFTRKVEDPVAGGPPHGLPQARLIAFHENLERLPNQRLVAPQLNLALHFLQHRQAAAFLFFRNGIGKFQRGGVRPRRKLEGENLVVLNFREQ